MQRKETANSLNFTDLSAFPRAGRILAIDPGTKRVGLAVSDPNQLIATPIRTLARTSWKKLLADIKDAVSEFDAVAIVVGLPLDMEGEKTDMTEAAQTVFRNLSLSLEIPVFQQDERSTSYEARGRLWQRGGRSDDVRSEVDPEAASIILSDFLDRLRG
ncbi:MAG TPA: Holliday junction resolvase RuvX [Pyrinomonadaceae bacterium]